MDSPLTRRTVKRQTITSEQSSYSEHKTPKDTGSVFSSFRRTLQFMSPPVRNSHSPRFTADELDALTSTHLPYKTNYTYAYSKIYDPSLPDHWEVPNLGVVTADYTLEEQHWSAPSISRQIVYLLSYPATIVLKILSFFFLMIYSYFWQVIDWIWYFLHYIIEGARVGLSKLVRTYNSRNRTGKSFITVVNERIKSVFRSIYHAVVLVFEYSVRQLKSLRTPKISEVHSERVEHHSREETVSRSSRRITARPSLSPARTSDVPKRSIFARISALRQDTPSSPVSTSVTTRVFENVPQESDTHSLRRSTRSRRSVSPARESVASRSITRRTRKVSTQQSDDNVPTLSAYGLRSRALAEPVYSEEQINEKSYFPLYLSSLGNSSKEKALAVAKYGYSSIGYVIRFLIYCITIPIFAVAHGARVVSQKVSNLWSTDENLAAERRASLRSHDSEKQSVLNRLTGFFIFLAAWTKNLFFSTVHKTQTVFGNISKNGSKRRFWWLLPLILLLLILFFIFPRDNDNEPEGLVRKSAHTISAAAVKSRDTVHSWILGFIGFVQNSTAPAKEKLSAAISTTPSAITDAGHGLSLFFYKYLVAPAKWLANVVVDVVFWIWEQLKLLVGWLGRTAQLWLGKENPILNYIVYPIYNFVKSFIQEIGTFIVDVAFEIYTAFGKGWGYASENFVRNIKRFFSAIRRFVLFISSAVIDFVREYAGYFYEQAGLFIRVTINSLYRFYEFVTANVEYIYENWPPLSTFFYWFPTVPPLQPVPFYEKTNYPPAPVDLDALRAGILLEKTPQIVETPVAPPVPSVPVIHPKQDTNVGISHAALVAHITSKVREEMEAKFESYDKAYRAIISKLSNQNSEIKYDYSQLEALVRQMIYEYDADKTGQVDYALESSGASVISTRCSETYNSYSRLEKIWNIPLWYSSYGPRTVIQRNSKTLFPGECWSFKAGHGYLTIDLSHAINLTSVSYEHIGKELAPDGNRQSAPRNFKIWAYKQVDELDSRYLIGDYTYDIEGPPLQFFIAKGQPDFPVKIIELEVTSNYGAVFTCLYRLRVHGKSWSAP